MAVTRTKLPRWATDDVIDGTSGLNNVIEPSEAKKDVGWNYLEKPARQYFNWLGRLTDQWFNYLDESVNFFAPYETDPATMAISLNAGRINEGTNVIEVAAQNTGVMTSPITDPRIDRIVINETTGLAAIVAGVENAVPVAPDFNRDQFPIAQILLYVGMTEIVNADITDERSQAPFNDQLASDLFITKPDSTGIGVYLQNSTTGSTATDGFFVGINDDEKPLLWNYEATDLLIGVANSLKVKIAAGGRFLFTANGTDIFPQHEFVIYNAAVGGKAVLQFINDGTGSGLQDGLLIGMDASEQAQIWNYENTATILATNNLERMRIEGDGSVEVGTGLVNQGAGTLNVQNGVYINNSILETTFLVANVDLQFGTNNTLRGKIDNDGKWLISPNGTDIEPAHELVVYNSLAASDSFIQFINDATGITGADGLIVGLDPNEQAFIWNYENTDMVFATNNLERMRIESDGSVEVGTGLTNQGAGTLNVTGGLFINNNAVGGTFVVTNTDLAFGTNNTFRGKIDNGGNWLISPDGTDIEPSQHLTLYDNASQSAFAQFCNSTTGVTSTDGFHVGLNTGEDAIIWHYENEPMIFATNATERMRIEADGSVEIGTGLTNQGVGTLNVLNGIYSNNVKATKIVTLDTPIELLNTQSSSESWVTVNHATLNAASAISAILHLVCVAQTATESVTNFANNSTYIRKTGSALAANNLTFKLGAQTFCTVVGEIDSRTNDAEIIVNLNGSYDFDYYTKKVLNGGTGLVVFRMYLVGYVAPL